MGLTRTFVTVVDPWVALAASSRGKMNTRNHLMTVHLKTQTENYKADRMHIILLAEQTLELGDTGSMVYD